MFEIFRPKKTILIFLAIFIHLTIAVEIKCYFTTALFSTKSKGVAGQSRYACEFIGVTLNNDTEIVTIKSDHNTKTNSDVKLVEFSSSAVKFIPKIVYETFPNMDYFLIWDNIDFPNIEQRFFEGIPDIKILRVLENKIRAINANVFIKLPKSLEIVNLQNNQIEVVDALAFAGLSTVGELYLQQNKIAALEDGTFQYMSNLSELNLQNNLIEKVSEQTFSGLVNLKNLNMQSNKIKVLHYEAFNEFSKLNDIDLRNNVCINKWFKKLNGSMTSMSAEIFTACHDFYLLEELIAFKNYSGDFDAKIANMTNLILLGNQIAENAIQNLENVRITPMKSNIENITLAVQALNATVMSKQINIAGLNGTILKFKNDSQANITKNLKNLTAQVSLINQKSENISMDLSKGLSFAGDQEKETIKNISNTIHQWKVNSATFESQSLSRISSLKVCIIIEFIVLFTIVAAIAAFIYRKFRNPDVYIKESAWNGLENSRNEGAAYVSTTLPA